MGKRTAGARFDLARSRVDGRGTTLEVSFADPRWDDLRTATYLQLQHENRSVRGLLVVEQRDDGTASARCSVPRTKLSSGRWQLSVQTVAGPRPIGAALVIRPDRFELAAGGPTGRERVALAGRRVLDAVLAPLPPHRAKAIRGKARRIARALLK